MRGVGRPARIGRLVAEGWVVTDEEFAALEPPERDFALAWVRMSDAEQDKFCRGLLAAIEVLQRLGVLEAPSTEGPLPA